MTDIVNEQNSEYGNVIVCQTNDDEQQTKLVFDFVDPSTELQEPLDVDDILHVDVRPATQEDYVEPISKSKTKKSTAGEKRKRAETPGAKKRLALANATNADEPNHLTVVYNNTEEEEDGDFEWKVSFNQPQSFKTSLSIISSLVKTIGFVLYKSRTSEKSYIQFNNIDDHQTCIIAFKLVCDIEDSDNINYTEAEALLNPKAYNMYTFSIDGPELSQAIRKMNNKAALVIYKKKNTYENTIVVDSYDPISLEHKTIEIVEIDNEDDPVKLDEIEYDYTLEMGLKSIKDVVDDASKAKAQEIWFEIDELKPSVAAEHEERHTFFRIRYSAGTIKNISTTFHSTTAEDTDDVIKIKSSESLSMLGTRFRPKDMDRKYRDSFAVGNLSLFLKGMEKNTVTLKLSASMMMIEYSLGLDSYICLMCIPKAKQEGDNYEDQPVVDIPEA